MGELALSHTGNRDVRHMGGSAEVAGARCQVSGTEWQVNGVSEKGVKMTGGL